MDFEENLTALNDHKIKQQRHLLRFKLIGGIFIICCGLVGFIISNRAVVSQYEEEVSTVHVNQMIAATERVLKNLLAAESAQRGYLLTKNLDTHQNQYLYPYSMSQQNVWKSLDQVKTNKSLIMGRLKQLNTSEGYELNQYYTRLESLVTSKFIELNDTLTLVDANYQAALDMVATDKGLRIMNDISQLYETGTCVLSTSLPLASLLARQCIGVLLLCMCVCFLRTRHVFVLFLLNDRTCFCTPAVVLPLSHPSSLFLSFPVLEIPKLSVFSLCFSLSVRLSVSLNLPLTGVCVFRPEAYTEESATSVP